MTTAYTSLLGLALPVTGELSGTWGDTVNNAITSLLDSAVAGTTNISTDGDVTLTTTTGAANQAREAILLFSGARTALRTVTAPAQSKIYTVINATTGGYAVKLVGSGPTTGVTIANGSSTTVAWNGSDFVEVSSPSSIILPNGTANGVLYLNGSKVVTSGSGLVFNGTNLGVGVSPTQAFTNSRAIQLGSGGLIEARSNDSTTFSLASNAYLDAGGNWTYSSNNRASLFALTNGTYSFGIAPAGTGAISFTTAMFVDSSGSLLINATSNVTADPYLYVAGNTGTLTTIGGLNHYSAGANNNGFIGGAYYSTSSTLIATATQSAQYQNASGEHIFYTNGGLTVGSTYTNVRRASINQNGVNIVGPLTTARTNLYASITPFWQAEGSSASGQRAISFAFNSAASTGGLFAFIKSRGTTEGSVTAVQISDEIGQLNWLGTDGTSPVLGASITAYAEGAVSTGTVPMKLSFQTGGTSGAIYSRYEIAATGAQYWKNITNNTYGNEMSLTATLLTTYNKKIECQSDASAGFDAFQIYGTGYSSDQKYWRTKTQNTLLQHQTMNDAYTVERTYMQVSRSGVNVQNIAFKTGASDTTRLFIQDSTGEVIVGYGGSLSSDCRFAVSNNNAIGFEISPGTVSGYTNDVRLLAYDRTANTYKNIRYSATTHTFNIGGTQDLMQLTSTLVSINPQSLTPAYGGIFKVTRSSATVGEPVVSFQQSAATSSEDFNVVATNASYSNTSTSGWGMQRNIAERTASSVFNFLTCTAASDTKFYLRGDGNAYADGTWNNNGADYAEYFESASGQEIAVGTSVVLDGNKVRPATSQDTNILGVVRPKADGINSMMIGNTAFGHWSGKYLQDDFGCFIMEDFSVVEWTETLDEWQTPPNPETGVEGVKKTKQHSYVMDAVPSGITVPANAVIKTHDDNNVKLTRQKVNPAWNPDAEYTPREKRPEWLIIGLLGQIRILKGQPTGSNWVKMRDISALVEEWFVK